MVELMSYLLFADSSLFMNIIIHFYVVSSKKAFTLQGLVNESQQRFINIPLFLFLGVHAQ